MAHASHSAEDGGREGTNTAQAGTLTHKAAVERGNRKRGRYVTQHRLAS